MVCSSRSNATHHNLPETFDGYRAKSSVREKNLLTSFFLAIYLRSTPARVSCAENHLPIRKCFVLNSQTRIDTVRMHLNSPNLSYEC